MCAPCVVSRPKNGYVRWQGCVQDFARQCTPERVVWVCVAGDGWRLQAAQDGLAPALALGCPVAVHIIQQLLTAQQTHTQDVSPLKQQHKRNMKHHCPSS